MDLTAAAPQFHGLAHGGLHSMLYRDWLADPPAPKDRSLERYSQLPAHGFKAPSSTYCRSSSSSASTSRPVVVMPERPSLDLVIRSEIPQEGADPLQSLRGKADEPIYQHGAPLLFAKARSRAAPLRREGRPCVYKARSRAAPLRREGRPCVYKARSRAAPLRREGRPCVWRVPLR